MTEQPDWMIPDPWEIEEDKRQADVRRAERLARRREYNRQPEVVARRQAYISRPEVKERLRAYHREYARRRRAMARLVTEPAPRYGGLHELACSGPHKNHKACQVIPVYRGEDAA